MELGLQGRAVLVAGASRGIGLAVARGFLVEGAHIGLIARGEAQLDAATNALRADHPGLRVESTAADLSDPAATTQAVSALAGELGGLDVAVANAGSGRGVPGWDLSEDDWRGALDENLLTAANLCAAAVPHVRPAGALCLVGSIAGLMSSPAPLPYKAAKAALERYGHDLARELAPSGVRVNVVAPGNVLFEGGRWQELIEADRDGVEAMVSREVPLARFGTPDEIAATVVFLCSAVSGFTTGTTVVVDGGQRGD